jgi:hypothetical protein
MRLPALADGRHYSEGALRGAPGRTASGGCIWCRIVPARVKTCAAPWPREDPSADWSIDAEPGAGKAKTRRSVSAVRFRGSECV